MPAPTDRDTSRWRKAQAYEASWWRSNAGSFNTRYLESLARHVAQAVGLTGGSEVDVVEVGAGPVGVAPFLGAGRRVATDPLDGSFDREPTYRRFRESARTDGAVYVAAKGENLPFDDASFDLYVTDNVLDHVDDPARVLAEARRVLRPGGLAFVRVHVYHGWGRTVRRAMELAEIDQGHPHTFSTRALRSMAEAQGFSVVQAGRSSYLRRWVQDGRRGLAGSRRALVQAGLAVTRADYELVLRRSAGPPSGPGS